MITFQKLPSSVVSRIGDGYPEVFKKFEKLSPKKYREIINDKRTM